MRPTLEELAIRYSNDKYYSHSYLPLYQQLFEGRKVGRLLEIGIGYRDLMEPFVPRFVHGSSLRMFREFFPSAEIWGVDIREDAMISGEPSIFTLIADQSKREDLEKLARLGPWDVVIDDGSHQTEHQILTAEVLLPTVRKGGVYIVEDVQEPERVSASIPGSVIHRFDKRPDDVLVVKEVLRTSS